MCVLRMEWKGRGRVKREGGGGGGGMQDEISHPGM